MTEVLHACCICADEADWVRVRMPNKEQMDFLCHRHYQSLQHRNPILADYYDAIASVDPLRMPSEVLSEQENRLSVPERRERE